MNIHEKALAASSIWILVTYLGTNGGYKTAQL